MQNRLTAKLFHTVVVLGVGMTSGCSDDTTPQTPSTSASSTTSSSGALADGGKATTGTSASSSSTSGDALPGWVCCG